MDRQRFADRRDAGRVLAGLLENYRGQPDVLVLALPRGGVPVASEIARTLDLDLDVFVVRKLGFPGQPELAMGAIASGGVRVLNTDLLRAIPVSTTDLEATAAREQAELDRRERTYRAGGALRAVEGRTVILVDDGLATGSTMRAAVMAVRRLRPHRVIVAVPVGATDTCRQMRAIADELVCPIDTPHLGAVGLWYADFRETTDAEVRALLEANEVAHKPDRVARPV